MWFRRGNRSKRTGRSEMLEVRSRCEPARRERRRLIIRSLVWALIVCAILVGLSYGWSLGRKKILDTGLFSLRTIEITTDGAWVTAEQVKRWAGIREGMNILDIDLSRVRRDLELVPQVKSASVERVLPHLLRVRVVEREPVARIQSLAIRDKGSFVPTTYYIDSEGVIIPGPQAGEVALDLLPRLESLPLIRGIPQRDLFPGKKVNSPSVDGALRLLASFLACEMAGQIEVVAIDVSIPGLMTVRSSDGAAVVLASTDVEEQLRRWRLVRDTCAGLGKAISYLDLSITNNCPLRWVEVSNAPPPRPRPARHSGRTSKHV